MPDAAASYLSDCARAMGAVPVGQIRRFAEAFDLTRRAGGTVYVFGNGACAALSEHVATDFSKTDALLRKGVGPPLTVISLASNAAMLTALGNDLGFDHVFVEQLRGRLLRQDLVVGLSASGRSPNVLRAMEHALSVGTTTAALTGAMVPDPPIVRLSRLCIQVASDQIDQIEDVHVAVHHALVRRSGSCPLTLTWCPP